MVNNSIIKWSSKFYIWGRPSEVKSSHYCFLIGNGMSQIGVLLSAQSQQWNMRLVSTHQAWVIAMFHSTKNWFYYVLLTESLRSLKISVGFKIDFFLDPLQKKMGNPSLSVAFRTPQRPESSMTTGWCTGVPPWLNGTLHDLSFVPM